MTVAGFDAVAEVRPRRPREYEVALPVGYLDPDGRLHRKATLRKLTGHEEALLADRKLRANAGKLVTELLNGCLRSLGDLTQLNRQVIGDLTSPDRNFLLLELRKLTFGTDLEASYTCPACRETTMAIEDLDSFPVRVSDTAGMPEIVVELEDGFEDRGRGRGTDGWYDVLRFRLPVGTDEERVASVARENAAKGTNALLARCLVSVSGDGEEMPENRREALGTKLLSDLTMSDRARIERAFRDEMPGVDLSRDFDCESCGRPMRTTLDLTSFFTPN
ncbi:T4 family baseplate hub assembly chaperone [Flindersiella endophytica]